MTWSTSVWLFSIYSHQGSPMLPFSFSACPLWISFLLTPFNMMPHLGPKIPQMDLWDWWKPSKATSWWNSNSLKWWFLQQRNMNYDFWLMTYVLWYVSTANWVSSNQNINEVHNQSHLNAWQTESSGWSPDCPSSRVLWNISIPAMVAFMGLSWHTGGRFKDAWYSQICSEGIIARMMHCCQCRTQAAIPLRLAFG